MKELEFERGKHCWQIRPYGTVEVLMLCNCEGCKKAGGVTVEYQMIPSIARLSDLSRRLARKSGSGDMGAGINPAPAASLDCVPFHLPPVSFQQ